MADTTIAPDVDVKTEGPEDAPEDADGALVEEELLVEEISIDGMCGVY